MTELTDEQVFGPSGPQKEMTDEEVFGRSLEPPTAGEAIPEAFLDRLRAGQALGRILSAAGHEAKEGAVGQTPTGYSDERLGHMINIGVFHDPDKGRPGPIQMANEAVLFPIAQAWQSVTSAMNAGIHGAGGAVEQLVTEFGGSQGTANRAKNETINAGNWAMIEGGMGRFSRPASTPEGVMDQTIGGLPKPEDFTNAAKVLAPESKPASNLRLMEAPEGGVYEPEQVKPNEKYFKAVDASGNTAAEMLVRFDGKTANIEDILAPGKPREEGRGAIGTADMRSLLRQFQEAHPEIETITGKRVSGARMEGGYSLLDQPTQVEVNLRRMWQEDGIHPAEAVHDAQNDAFLKNEIVNGKQFVLRSEPSKAAIPEGFDALPIDQVLKKGAMEDSPFIGADGQIIGTGGDHLSLYNPAEQREANALRASVYRDKEGRLTTYVEARDGQSVTAEQIDTLRQLTSEPNSRFGFSIKKGDEFGVAASAKNATLDEFIKATGAPDHAVVRMAAEDLEALTETGGKPGSLSAAITPPEEIPIDVQPASPPGRLIASAQQAAETLFDIGRDIQMKLTPMARGTMDSMATVKDYMNSMRRNSWDAARIDQDTVKRFTPEDHVRMANAMEEESLSLRLGEPASAREHQGLATLTPEERAFVVEQDTRQQLAWLRLRDLGAVEGDGIAMHYPRMVVGIPKGLDKSSEGALSLTAIGYDLRSKTPFMKQRKHIELESTEKAIKEKVGMQLAKQGKSVDEINAALEKVKVVRDIRAVNLATKQLEDAVAGRTLIKNIQDVGKRTGEDVIAEGFKPDNTWFTVDHPVFKAWRPKLTEVEGKFQAVKDANGKPVFEQVPIYVRGDFEGPLRSAMWGTTSATYSNMMALKGKTMGLIMNSPAIHNLVEFGRAFPTMPIRIFKAYFDGNRAKNDPAIMHEAINSGLVPIGKRFFNQDITGLMEAPDLTPGRSQTAKIAAAVPGLFDEAAGVAVKRAVDKMGDFWHNTLLWDRIADLQMGLYTNFRGDMIGKGMDQQTASRVAAHMANRYAGALPKEAMSEAATKVSNFVFFSRSFTFGNLGVMKDMLTGLPKDVLAQIERDSGFGKGSIEGFDADALSSEIGGKKSTQQAVDAVKFAKGIARRKAMATIGLDVALAYAGNSVLQSAFNVLLGDRTIGQEEHEYWRRAQELMNEAKVHPLSLLNPFHVMQSLSATNENEPGRKDRVLIGNAKDGTAIYGRNPVGKIGEEFTGYFSGPLDMIRKKEGTIMRPLMQIFSNDAGFGRKVYDPDADSAMKRIGVVEAIVEHMIGSQLPMGQIKAARDLVKGDGDKTVNLLQALGPLGGFTFSKGAPGGPEVGVMYSSKSRHDFEVSQALPDIRKQILRGDVNGADDRLIELDVPQGLRNYYIKSTLDPSLRMSPRAVKDFYLHSNDVERSQFDRLRDSRAKQAPPPAPAPPPQKLKDPSLIMNGPPAGLGIRG